MIQITLGKEKSIDPATDPLGRSLVGWTDGLAPQQIYDIARWAWVMPGDRVEQERYAVVSGGGIIRLVIEIDRVVDAIGGRRAFEGRILGPGNSVHDHYMDKPAPNGSQRNPITYFESPFDRRVCACGCEEPIKRGTFLPGHDQRAIHERIAKVGSVKDFIDWFDATWQSAQAR